MVIIDNKEDLQKLRSKLHSDNVNCVPILSDTNFHPKKNRISLLYFEIDSEEFILPINHCESVRVKPFDFKFDFKFNVLDKKSFLHLISEKLDVTDINLKYYLSTNQQLNVDEFETNAHHFYNRKYYKSMWINDVIPIMKHLEYCRKIISKIKDMNETHDEYDTDLNNALYHIENNGIQTTTGIEYTSYNPFTSTGRPSNSFSGINYAALNKKDGSRKRFISRFGKDGMLVEMDFDAYHLRLIGEVIGYKFPKGSVHEHMAKFYGCDYDEAKSLSFKYLYGFIPDDIKKINPFFEKVSDFIDKLWKDYKSTKTLTSNIYSRRIMGYNLHEMNKNKLFNYMIQTLETENNISILNKLIPSFVSQKSKLVLYNYDSFLVDFSNEDGVDFLRNIKETIEQNGKYPVKVSRGLDYDNMKDITEKF
jgi:hypothetical protein|tara:strand:+ start:1157 stop:2419 length:1263 start_codon:yes stop_codon:yes gene_type:complete